MLCMAQRWKHGSSESSKAARHCLKLHRAKPLIETKNQRSCVLCYESSNAAGIENCSNPWDDGNNTSNDDRRGCGNHIINSRRNSGTRILQKK